MDANWTDELFKQAAAWDKVKREESKAEAKIAIQSIADAVAAYYQALIELGISEQRATTLAQAFQGQFLQVCALMITKPPKDAK